MRDFVSTVRAWLGLTPDTVKQETTDRLSEQAKRIQSLQRNERMRADYRMQDDAMSGKR